MQSNAGSNQQLRKTIMYQVFNWEATTLPPHQSPGGTNTQQPSSRLKNRTPSLRALHSVVAGKCTCWFCRCKYFDGWRELDVPGVSPNRHALPPTVPLLIGRTAARRRSLRSLARSGEAAPRLYKRRTLGSGFLGNRNPLVVVLLLERAVHRAANREPRGGREGGGVGHLYAKSHLSLPSGVWS